MATSLDVERLDEGLATIRKHWQRWSRDGFDPGEINVARWRFAGSLPLARLTGHALAYQLFSEWNVEPAALANEPFQFDFAGLQAARVSELFSTCKANAVLGLTGNESAIRRALKQAWPSLAQAPAR
ncbi:MAG: hypothetical protein WCG85_20810 [Polyangia bacterium]